MSSRSNMANMANMVNMANSNNCGQQQQQTFLEQKIVGAIIIIFNTAQRWRNRGRKCDAYLQMHVTESPGFSAILWVPRPYFMGCLQRRRSWSPYVVRWRGSWTSAIFIAAAHIITIILKVGEGQAHNDNRRSHKNSSWVPKGLLGRGIDGGEDRLVETLKLSSNINLQGRQQQQQRLRYICIRLFRDVQIGS